MRLCRVERWSLTEVRLLFVKMLHSLSKEFIKPPATQGCLYIESNIRVNARKDYIIARNQEKLTQILARPLHINTSLTMSLL